MITLTLQFETPAELKAALSSLSCATSPVNATKAEPTSAPKARTEKASKPEGTKETKPETEKVTVPTGIDEAGEVVTEEVEITYDDVKDAVLHVAKVCGRDASLDLLEPFGVTSGTGTERKGNITKLKEDQYAAVVEAAEKLLK